MGGVAGDGVLGEELMEIVADLGLGVAVHRSGGRMLKYVVTHTPPGLKTRQLHRQPGNVSFERTEAAAMAEARGLVEWLGKFKKFPMLIGDDHWPWTLLEIA